MEPRLIYLAYKYKYDITCFLIGKAIRFLYANHSLTYMTSAHTTHCYWQECKNSYLHDRKESIFFHTSSATLVF